MARRFKINPEKYGKIKERNYRGSDWNTDSGNYDCPSKRKKKTVLDDDCGYMKASDLNRDTRLLGTDTIRTAMQKLSDCNHNAMLTLMLMNNELNEFDMFKLVCGLDSLGIYGDNISMLYKNAGSAIEVINRMTLVYGGDIQKSDLVV